MQAMTQSVFHNLREEAFQRLMNLMEHCSDSSQPHHAA